MGNGTRRQRKGVMLCYPYEIRRLDSYKKPFFVQPKYDGIRCIATIDEDKRVWLETATGMSIETVPHIQQELEGYEPRIPIKFDGELYIHGDFSKLCSIVKRNYTVPEHIQVKYVVFDIISKLHQEERLLVAHRWIHNNFDNIELAPYHRCESHEEIAEQLRMWYGLGYEGVVVRHSGTHYKPARSTDIMKWKPTKSDTYRIVGYKPEMTIQGEIKPGSLGAFLVQAQEGETFSVGSGFTRSQREKYWKYRDTMIGMNVRVQYQELSQYGVPRFPVFIEVVD